MAWKLKARGLEEEIGREVINELQAAGWQDERRFTESFIRSHHSRGQGPVKIRFELRQKGIDDTLIEEVMLNLDLDWIALAKQIYRRKYGQRPIPDRNEYGRRYRFMAQRGFEMEQIRTLLDDS